MNSLKRTLSIMVVFILLATCLTGCAENSLLSLALSKNNPQNSAIAANQTSTKDKIDQKNNEELLEKMKKELAEILIDSDKARLDSLSTEEIETIYKMKNNMLSNMKLEFNYNKVTALVDSADATVTFSTDSFFNDQNSVFTSEGEKLLTRFLQVYSFILYNAKYENLVSNIVLEYYTGADESTALAQSRLNAIREYTGNRSKSGISSSYDGKFNRMLSTKSFSYDGTEAAAKSSVTFRFKIKLDYSAE